MNSAKPSKPLNDVFPNYGGNNKPSANKTLYHRTHTKPKADTAGKVEPITSRQWRSARYASTGRNAMTNVEERMMQVSKNRYTLQLMGGRNLGAIQAFIRKNDLEGKAVYYSAKLNHKNWYMLVYGNFSTAAQAHAAARDLPPTLRRLHPWVKSYRIVHDEIRLRRIVT